MHDENVAVAGEGRESAAPGSARRDEHFRDADRQRMHSGHAEQRTLGAAEAENAVEALFAPQPQHDFTHAAGHQLHGGTAAARRANLLNRVTGLQRHLGAGDVSNDSIRLAEDPGVDDDRLCSERLDPLANVRDLRTFRVERGDDDDLFHRDGSSGFAAARTTRNPGMLPACISPGA